MVVDENNSPEEPAPFWRAAWKPLAVVVAVHLAIVIVYSAFFDFNPSCFLNVGSGFQWADEAHFAPGTVKYTRMDGYDACDYYLVALDPLMLHKDVAPTYKIAYKFMRYQRFVYPLLVYLLAFGNPRFFPEAMLFINFFSMIGATVVLMKLLMRRGASPWLSLIFLFSGGMLLAFWLDLQMHLCFFLIVSALYYYETKRVGASALLFAIALVTWESAVLFAGPIGLWELLHRRWKTVLCFILVPVPFLFSQLYYSRMLGAALFSGSPEAVAFPLKGMWQSVADIIQTMPAKGTVGFLRDLLVVPVMAFFVVMLVAAGWKLCRKKDSLYDLMLVLQLLFVFVQAKDIWLTFTNAMRINAGLFLVLILSYRDRKERISPWLFVWGMGLAALALVRIFITVREPYVLIGGG